MNIQDDATANGLIRHYNVLCAKFEPVKCRAMSTKMFDSCAATAHNHTRRRTKARGYETPRLANTSKAPLQPMQAAPQRALIRLRFEYPRSGTVPVTKLSGPWLELLQSRYEHSHHRSRDTCCMGQQILVWACSPPLSPSIPPTPPPAKAVPHRSPCLK